MSQRVAIKKNSLLENTLQMGQKVTTIQLHILS